MAEHGWEKLYIERDGRKVYAYIDRCSDCRVLRSFTAKNVFRYRKQNWTFDEPSCKEAS